MLSSEICHEICHELFKKENARSIQKVKCSPQSARIGILFFPKHPPILFLSRPIRVSTEKDEKRIMLILYTWEQDVLEISAPYTSFLFHLLHKRKI
jgi:hypothetical protein